MTQDSRRCIPPVHELADRLIAEGRSAGAPRGVVVEVTRGVLERSRRSMGSGDGGRIGADDLTELIVQLLQVERRPPLPAVINATGIIVHTGLGRAPLAQEAQQAIAEVAGRFAPVELDLETGARGKRGDLLRPLVCRLTGAESATVVNNNAAALVLVLAALAQDRDVVVSRGELIEIGGSFRLPEIMATGGARMREVGTTNRTRVNDYEGAIGESTAALLKVHASNYRITGFTESVSIEALAALGRRRGVLVIHDIGSGALRPLSVGGRGLDEPDAASSIRGGADLVLFSGDKLLGGPQAGIIAGRRELIERIERHPLMRALRVGRLTLAALAATLRLHLDEAWAMQRVPVLAMATAPSEAIRRRAEGVAKRLAGLSGLTVEVRSSAAYLGGGSVPATAIASSAVVIRAASIAEDDLARRLRLGRPPVVARVSDGAVWLDLRTVFEDEEDALAEAIERASG